MKKIFILLFSLFYLMSFGQVSQQNIDAYKGTATGTNSYSVTINAVTITAPYDGQKIWVKFGNANSGASTLKVNSYTAQAITLNSSALAANDIIINQYTEFIYYLAGTSWQMQKPGGGASMVTSVSAVSPLSSSGGATPTITITSPLPIVNGGTNNTLAYTSGSVVFSDGTKLTQDNSNFFWDDSNNQLGIGTTSTSAKLHVVGTTTTVSTFPLLIQNSASNILLKVYASGQIEAGNIAGGNLFIGEKCGLNNLFVAGQDSADNNTGYGDSSFYVQTKGRGNVAVGTGAMKKNSCGAGNVAVGFQALYNNQYCSSAKSDNNTAIGYQAIYTNRSAVGLTAVGSFALYNDTTSNNDAFGYKAMYSNVGGVENMGVGTFALYSNISGTSNMAFGKEANYSNTLGNYNNTHGWRALYDNVIGSYNNCTGYASLRFSTSDENTAIGHTTGLLQVGGGKNSYFGAYSGKNNISGSNVVGVGFSAAQYNLSSNKIFIGNFDYVNATLENQRTPIVITSHATDSSQTEIRLNGFPKIVNGSQGNGKVLTSDANGVGTWITPSAGTSTTVNAGTNITVTGAVSSPTVSISGIIGLANGGTSIDMTATGGTSQFLKQNTLGGTPTLTQPSVADLSDYNYEWIQIEQALGSTVKAQPFHPSRITTTSTWTDAQVYVTAVYLPFAQTVTGVKWYTSVVGVYTADNNNKVGLYSYSGGTLTLVASSTNDGNLWQAGSANTVQSKAFSSTYAAAAGVYFIAALYNNSSQVTAATIGAPALITNAGVTAMDFTNSALYNAQLGSQTDLPASSAMSGWNGSTSHRWLAIY